MLINILIFFSLILNIIFILYKYKKKIKIIFSNTHIKTKNLSELNPIFELKKISENLSGPNKQVIIKSFCISSENQIVGMTSDYEAWIIGCLSKISKNIFEFGTCSGKTTYLMALNSNDETKITSITINPRDVVGIDKKIFDNKISYRNLIKESVYEKFLFSGEIEEKKINVIFQNSLEFSEIKYENSMDLIFIDGGHTYSVVKNDSEKAFKMLKKNGIILWHDYVLGKQSSKDIVKYLNKISRDKKIYNIENTSLCYFIKK